MTSVTSPLSIQSSTCGDPSPILFSRSTKAASLQPAAISRDRKLEDRREIAGEHVETRLVDPEGRITEFNRAAEQMFGYQRAQVIGKTIAETRVSTAPAIISVSKIT